MRRYVIGMLVSFIVVAGLFAQSRTATIRGVVVDASGAVAPGALVRLSRPQVPDRTAQTDASGEFIFRLVAPGRYTVSGSFAAASTESRQVEVASGGVARLVLTLPVAVPVSLPAPPAEQQRPRPSGRMAEWQLDQAQAGVPEFSGVAAMILRRPFNTETYDPIADNQWHQTAHVPLSTFSADVDTASYSNVRRYLNLGQAPPRDAVRIEELINYFPFDYPEPQDGRPFSATTAIGECPWNPAHRLALVGLQARRIDARHIPPRNLVFLIDVSGSMDEERKLPLVKASLAMLAPNLTDKDRVAIVVYAGSEGLVLPSTVGSDTAAILGALHALEAGGSTNGGAGIQLAYTVAQEHFIQGGVNRVILATDGDFNVGVTSQGALLRLIEERRKSGIALSVLGYGMGNLKDSTMVKLADAGNGNYAYIDSLSEAQKVLVEQAGGTLVTVAKDVKLQVEFNPREVGAYRLIGYEKRLLEAQDFNNDKKDAGEIGAGHSVTALYELAPPGEEIPGGSVDGLKYQTSETSAAARQGEAMTVKIRYKAPNGDVSSLMTTPVGDRTAFAPALGFAAAVAEFGMLLRDSDLKGSSSFAAARALAQRFKGDDAYGHRAEFIRLIGAAERISTLKTSSGR
jgi:Ca-activated chloride channel homolog